MLRKKESGVPEPLPSAAAERRNLLAQILHGTFGQAGQRLITAPTFMPAFLLSVFGSEFLVGLCRALQALGAALSPAVTAHFLGQRRALKGAALSIALLARLPLLGLALLATVGAGPFLAAGVVVTLFIFGLCQGAQQVALNLLRARAIRRGRRGAALGMRNFFGGLSAMALALWLGNRHGEDGYGMFFALAFFLTATGVVCLLMTVEGDLPTSAPPARGRLQDTFNRIWAHTRDPSPFRTFLESYAFTCMSRMALPFYILFLTTGDPPGEGASLESIGLLSAVWIGAAVLSRLPLGLLADALGGVRIYRFGVGLWFLGNSVFLAMSAGAPKGLGGIVLGLAILGIGSAATELTAQNLVLDLGENEAAPQRLSATTTVAQCLVAIGQLLGGAVLQFSGFFTLTAATGCLLLAALLRAGRLPSPSPGLTHREIAP